MEALVQSIENQIRSSDLSFISDILSVGTTLSLTTDEDLSAGSVTLLVAMQRCFEEAQEEIARLKSEKQAMCRQVEELARENEELKRRVHEISVMESYLPANGAAPAKKVTKKMEACLLYTSDAADE
eukprot:TRINITY_DN10105_c0_g1_i2.p1 TRINITY_DN10105_c0_g1~~TRINITY_DN10105_c0_g1_i2.p1  ORF type:complete len:127 (+),score=34.51 TRINITY_DN10105_c0_g1_i2:151-531(+)